MSLFRKEAIEACKGKMYGEVVLTTPVKYTAVMIVLLFFMATLLTFGITQNYSRKESTKGFLYPKDGVTQIYSEKNLFIESIKVKQGDFVKKGSVLAEFSSASASSNGIKLSDYLKDSVEVELISNQRSIENLVLIKTLEGDSLKNNILLLETEKKDLKSSIESTSLRLDLIRTQKEQLEKAVSLGIETSEKMLRSKVEFLTAEQSLNSLLQQEKLVELRIKGANQEAKIKLRQLDEQLNTFTQRAEQLLQQQTISQMELNYTILAPTDGYVTAVYAKAFDFSKAGRLLFSMQKHGDTLDARLFVPSRTIGLIEKGQSVSIQLDAFPYQRFGSIKGEILSISKNPITPAEFEGPIQIEESSYIVEVNINNQTMSSYGKDMSFMSGMTLNAEITLESTPLVEWLLSPIRAYTRK